MDETTYLLALHRVNGLGPIRLKVLLDYYKDAKLAWQANPSELIKLGIPKNVAQDLAETRRKLDPEAYRDKIAASGIKWLTIFDESYPKRLREIYDPPSVLFFRGKLEADYSWAIAVVGTRKITGYGKLVTEKLTRELVEAGVTIVSGLARGVDSQAHRTTLENGGRTLAVLGGGLDHIFPPENERLAREIIEAEGAVLSEFPPDYSSLPGNFPARNRIISGLSLAVLVTEAAEDSGSLITAKCALEQGRDVFAVPGPITSDLSKGPSLLIKQGARLVTEAGEILQELGIDRVISEKPPKAPCFAARRASLAEGGGKVIIDVKLSEVETKVLENLANEDKHVDEVCRELGCPAAEVSAALVKMEIYGLVKNLGGGFFAKVC